MCGLRLWCASLLAGLFEKLFVNKNTNDESDYNYWKLNTIINGPDLFKAQMQ